MQKRPFCKLSKCLMLQSHARHCRSQVGVHTFVLAIRLRLGGQICIKVKLCHALRISGT